MAGMTPVLWEPSLSASQDTVTIDLPFALATASGVNAASYIGQNKPRILVSGGSGSALVEITQATVDALLGSTNEILVTTAFGTTAMVDNNTYAWVLDCGGQIAEALEVEVLVNIGGTLGTSMGIGTTTALTNSTFTLSQVYVTALGNLAGRITYTNVSAAATAGNMLWSVRCRIK